MHHGEVAYIKTQEHDKDTYYHYFYSSMSYKKMSKRQKPGSLKHMKHMKRCLISSDQLIKITMNNISPDRLKN